MSDVQVARQGDWMQGPNGRQLWPLDPRMDDIYIEDIAHALAQEVRYGGHAPRPYSVAQHSVLVSQRAQDLSGGSRQMGKTGLLHDAPEAYVKDIPRPLKKSLPGYAEIEDRWWVVVAKRFDLDLVGTDMPACVLQADEEVLATEKESFFPVAPAPWGLRYPPLNYTITPLGFDEAKALFLARWEQVR